MTTHRIRTGDLLQAHSRMITVLGPLSFREPAALARTLRDLMAPHRRIGLVPEPGARHWSFDREAGAPRVSVAPPCAPDEVDARLTELAADRAPKPPIALTLAGDYLFVDMCHGLGDGGLIEMTNVALAAGTEHPEVRKWFGGKETRNPLLRSALGHFLAEPSRLAEGVRLLRGAPAAARAESPRPLRDWRPQPALAHATIDPEAAVRLARYREKTMPGVSLAAVLFARLHAELGAAGIRTDDAMTVVYDCRRYLPENSRVRGNFVAGVELRPTDPDDPAALHRAMVGAGATGKPLATMAAQVLRDRRSGVREVRLPTSVVETPRARLGASYLHCGAGLSELPWRSGALGTYVAFVEPAHPELIACTVMRRRTVFDITATYHANVFEPAAVQAALAALTTWPPEGHRIPLGRAS
ncbi:hypothetical protein D5S18_19565 [Nocardia panacis]|uniref:Condensation domain-containing protein n=1 Tax=Nocardia panacis TaxID=2340916 RepID=A0A3A4KU79_9NOCA|nr:hypothetical protein [Nocardia panacis]RJO73424.1 hypothetical protein D5S18_19565 [Nocardia panacis]